MTIQGTIKLIGALQTFGASGFQKRELVITTEEQFPQHIVIDFTQQNTHILDSYQVGQQVKVDINIRGREWVNERGETKYFNSIVGWRIIPLVTTQSTGVTKSPEQTPMPEAQPFTHFETISNDDQNEEVDDLPF